MEAAEQVDKWLKPSEVSALFVAAGLYRVPLSTLRDWTAAGIIRAWRTPGGQRRYKQSDAAALVNEHLNAAPSGAVA